MPEAVIVGSRMTISCKALDDPGIPPAAFKWKRPGQSQFGEISHGDTLVISEVQLSDSGEYFCLPYNEHGSGEAGSARVFVRGKLKPAFCLMPYSLVSFLQLVPNKLCSFALL